MRAPLLVLAVLALAAGRFLGAAEADPPRQEPSVEAVRMAPDLWMLVGQGGNLGLLVTDEGLLLVDSQFQRMVPAIRERLDELGDGRRVKVLVNTHVHGDHVGGNPGFADEAVIVAHDAVFARMVEPPPGRETPPAAGRPDLTFPDRVTLRFGGHEVEVLHVGPAHTDGDAVLFFHDLKVVHMGDLLFAGTFPFIDPGSGGDVRGYLAAMRRVRSLLGDDWKVVPGHGPASTVADLDASIAMMEATMAIVEERIARGMDDAAVVAAGLPDEWASWSWRFVPTERWLETLVRGLRDG